MTEYVKMTSALRKATKNPEASDQFMQALEQHEQDRKAEYDRLFTQMREDNAKFIANLRHAIYWAAAFLGLAMTFLGIAVTFFGGG